MNSLFLHLSFMKNGVQEKQKTISKVNFKISIGKANNRDFMKIKSLIKQFELDNRYLSQSQFLVAKHNDHLVGFGRIRKHKTCYELCSIGVIEKFRRKGIASKLVKTLINKVTQPVYLVCIRPEYFQKLGFLIIEKYPLEMQNKLHYCTNKLVVPEKYIVMNYK